MADIFLSYAREDRDFAGQLASAFELHDWSVWWDPHIRAGMSFVETIERELRSARCVVVLWSRSSRVSEFVRDEAQDGLRRNALIPVSIDGSEPPLGFRQRQWADLSHWDGSPEHAAFRGLREDCARLLRGAAPALETAPSAAPVRGTLATRPHRVVGAALLVAASLLGVHAWLEPEPTPDVGTQPSVENGDAAGGGAPSAAEQKPSAPLAGEILEERRKTTEAATPRPTQQRVDGLRGSIVRIQLFFPAGSTAPDVEGIKHDLRKHAGIARTIAIEGHADNEELGNASARQRLSEERAQRLRTWLVEKEGVALDHITIQGFGESAPLAANTTPAGRAQNRRVQIDFAPD